MNLIATKRFKYPQDKSGRVLRIGERFSAEQPYAKTLIAAQLAVEATTVDGEGTPRRGSYRRRDMRAEE